MKKIFAILIAVLTSFSLTVSCFSLPAEPLVTDNSYLPLSAKSAILYEPDSGRVLYEKNADLRLGMASTTKLMSAIVALRMADPQMVITIPAEAVGVEGSSIYLVEGEKLTLRELLYALLLSSANDAAVAIAVSLCGSVEAFVERMNDYAAELGLSETNFTNPHGLYHANHYTTARELALIGAEALRSELLREIVSTKRATIPHDGVADKRLLVNHNKLLSSYEGAVGIKTGFTKKTGRTLVSAAKREGLTLIAVTLDAPDDWRDHKALLDFGFENYERTLLFPAGAFEYSLPLSGGTRSYALLTNAEPLWITRKKGDEAYSQYVFGRAHFLVAPVKKGEFFGTVTIGGDLGEVSSPLIIAESVDGTTLRQRGFFERIINFFKVE